MIGLQAAAPNYPAFAARQVSGGMLSQYQDAMINLQYPDLSDDDHQWIKDQSKKIANKVLLANALYGGLGAFAGWGAGKMVRSKSPLPILIGALAGIMIGMFKQVLPASQKMFREKTHIFENNVGFQRLPTWYKRLLMGDTKAN